MALLASAVIAGCGRHGRSSAGDGGGGSGGGVGGAGRGSDGDGRAGSTGAPDGDGLDAPSHADAADQTDVPPHADAADQTDAPPQAEAGGPDTGAPETLAEAGPIFPGCDPVRPDCPKGGACVLSCDSRAATCAPGTGGGLAQGSTCSTSADCGGGAACIDYTAGGCAIKLCRDFCNTDLDCHPSYSSNVGKNVCLHPHTCSDVATGYHMCTMTCDPSWKANNVTQLTGCGLLLACLQVDRDHADCGCPAKTRVKLEGAACGSSDECKPGSTCFGAGATKVCRALCRCNATGTTCLGGPGDDCPTAGTHCAPVADGVVYGVCLPS